MPSLIPLRHDVTKNAMANRLMDLFTRAESLSLSPKQEARMMKLMLEIAKEVNSMQGHRERTINHTNDLKVEIVQGSWMNGGLGHGQLPIEAKPDPAQLPMDFDQLPLVEYTTHELLHDDPDQEASPPSEGTVWEQDPQNEGSH